MKRLIIIPTYNEKGNIRDIILSIVNLHQDFHILVVDDSSPDGTAQIVKSLQNQFHHHLHLLIRKTKEGLGKAYLSGFEWAIKNHYDFICEMDADFSHNPNDLPRLFNACLHQDMVIGSRYCQGVNVVNWPMGRVLLSYFASKYVRFILGLPIDDTTAGFVCFKKETLLKIGLDKIKFRGYGFQIELKYRVFKKQLHFKEIPIIFTDRTKGESKMNGKIIKEAIWGVIYLKWLSFIKKI